MMYLHFLIASSSSYTPMRSAYIYRQFKIKTKNYCKLAKVCPYTNWLLHQDDRRVWSYQLCSSKSDFQRSYMADLCRLENCQFSGWSLRDHFIFNLHISYSALLIHSRLPYISNCYTLNLYWLFKLVSYTVLDRF